MRNDTMGVILVNQDKIPPITDIRANLSLPIAGRYRIIDFVLSNMSNAGITNIGVAAESNYSSLMDHIRSGKPWDLDRKGSGLKILPPSMEHKLGKINGSIDMLTGIRDFIRRSRETYVILSLGNNIYNMDFSKAIDEHIENQADVTAVYTKLSNVAEAQLSRYTLFDIDENNRIKDIEVMPYYPKTNYAGLDIYIMEKALLESFIDECSARGDIDFVKDALAKKLCGMRIFGYEHKGYVGKVDSMKSFYQCNMDFLNAEIRRELFNPENPIYTKTKDQSPTKYGNDAVVKNCFVSDGCIIDGTIENCVLSRGVRVAKGAVVKNSIIMQNSVIEEDVELAHVVFDKQVKITKGRKLIGQKSYPLAIEKDTEI